MSCRTGSRSKGSAKKIPLRSSDLNPTVAEDSKGGKAVAVLLNAGSKIASSLGVHWKSALQQIPAHMEDLILFRIEFGTGLWQDPVDLLKLGAVYANVAKELK